MNDHGAGLNWNKWNLLDLLAGPDGAHEHLLSAVSVPDGAYFSTDTCSGMQRHHVWQQ